MSSEQKITAEELLAQDVEGSWADHMIEEDEETGHEEEPHVDPHEREEPPQTQQQQIQAPAPQQREERRSAAPRSSPSTGYQRDSPSNRQSYNRGSQRRTFEKKVFTDADVPQDGPYVMYVANVSFEANRQNLMEVFAESNIVDVSLPYDRERRRTRGFAYIVFEDRDSLVKALSKQGVEVLGRSLRLDLTEKEKAQNIAERAHSRAQRRKENPGMPSSEADSTSTWRSAPKKPPTRNTRPLRSSPSVEVESPSSANVWERRKVDTPATGETTPMSAVSDASASSGKSTPSSARSQRRGDFRGGRGRGGSRGFRGGRGRGRGGRGGRGTPRSREQIELEKEFSRLMSDGSAGSKKTKSTKKSVSRNTFATLDQE